MRHVNHWASEHPLCDDCPTSRKIGKVVLTAVAWIVFTGMAAVALWYSPTIYHRGAEWLRAYSACVETLPNAATLGDWFLARRYCQRWAAQVISRP